MWSACDGTCQKHVALCVSVMVRIVLLARSRVGFWPHSALASTVVLLAQTNMHLLHHMPDVMKHSSRLTG